MANPVTVPSVTIAAPAPILQITPPLIQPTLPELVAAAPAPILHVTPPLTQPTFPELTVEAPAPKLHITPSIVGLANPFSAPVLQVTPSPTYEETITAPDGSTTTTTYAPDGTVVSVSAKGSGVF